MKETLLRLQRLTFHLCRCIDTKLSRDLSRHQEKVWGLANQSELTCGNKIDSLDFCPEAVSNEILVILLHRNVDLFIQTYDDLFKSVS